MILKYLADHSESALLHMRETECTASPNKETLIIISLQTDWTFLTQSKILSEGKWVRLYWNLLKQKGDPNLVDEYDIMI